MSSPKVIGNYKLGRTLGEGTYGKVKWAVNVNTGQEVCFTTFLLTLLHLLTPFFVLKYIYVYFEFF